MAEVARALVWIQGLHGEPDQVFQDGRPSADTSAEWAASVISRVTGSCDGLALHGGGRAYVRRSGPHLELVVELPRQGLDEHGRRTVASAFARLPAASPAARVAQAALSQLDALEAHGVPLQARVAGLEHSVEAAVESEQRTGCSGTITRLLVIGKRRT